MGWWDSLWSSGSSTDDPLRNLDPKLREFLERESPVKYKTAQKPATAATIAAEAEAKRQQQVADDAAAAAAKEAEENKPVVPKDSQYQDGRYAHLWKTYRPLAEIEAETKSDHERLMDVLEGYKERKSQIGRAALENCAFEQMDWRQCMNNPTFTERMTMCRDQVRKFEKCYMTQTRLLKALGYLSITDRSPEAEEEIQLHADTLYQRVVAQEAEITAAREAGLPIPKFPPLIPRVAPIPGERPQQQQQPQQQPQGELEELPPDRLEALRAKLKKVPEEERAAEEEAFRAEWRAKNEVAGRVYDLWRQQDEDRRVRKQRGEETMWDKVAGTFRSGDNPKDK